MFKDFREYLAHLERNRKLVSVKKAVNPRFGISAGIRKTSDVDGPAILFENIQGYPGWRVAAGLYSTRKLMALALELPVDASEDQLFQKYLECHDKCVAPKIVKTGPVKEIILKGDDIDLTRFPVPTYSERDAGPYFTAGVEFARRPETGEGNASIHRRRLLGAKQTALLAPPRQHLATMITEAEKKGQGLGIATVMGCDPSITIASQIKAPFGVDELEIAGGFRGAPIEVVKCETIDVFVPANAEIVIEGVTVPGERTPCGPFGEYPGNYVTTGGEAVRSAYVVNVTAITMRKDAIFQALLTGMPMTEGHWLKKWALAVEAHKSVSKLAEIKAINVTPGGATHFNMVVAIEKRYELQPRSVILNLLSSRTPVKNVVVVDGDINVYDPTDVEWAVATRTLPDKDIFIIPPVSRGLHEPSRGERATGCWGIDATMPLEDRDLYRKLRVPGAEEVDYL